MRASVRGALVIAVAIGGAIVCRRPRLIEPIERKERQERREVADEDQQPQVGEVCLPVRIGAHAEGIGQKGAELRAWVRVRVRVRARASCEWWW